MDFTVDWRPAAGWDWPSIREGQRDDNAIA
jgi:hypothetical protein